jgi:hypothetical protein
MRRELMALYDEYGHSQYTSNLLNVFGVVFPVLRGARDFAKRAEDRDGALHEQRPDGRR